MLPPHLRTVPFVFALLTGSVSSFYRPHTTVALHVHYQQRFLSSTYPISVAVRHRRCSTAFLLSSVPLPNVSFQQQRRSDAVVTTRCEHQRRSILYSRKFDNLDDDEQKDVVDKLVDAIGALFKLAGRSTPGRDDLALAFPVTLVVAAGLSQNWLQAIITIALFGAIATLTRKFLIVEDDADNYDDGQDDESVLRNPTEGTWAFDFSALVVAVLGGNLLTPKESVQFGLLEALGLLGVLLTLVLLLQGFQSMQADVGEESPQRRLMELWDRQFRRAQEQRGQNSREKETRKKDE